MDVINDFHRLVNKPLDDTFIFKDVDKLIQYAKGSTDGTTSAYEGQKVVLCRTISGNKYNIDCIIRNGKAIPILQNGYVVNDSKNKNSKIILLYSSLESTLKEKDWDTNQLFTNEYGKYSIMPIIDLLLEVNNRLHLSKINRRLEDGAPIAQNQNSSYEWDQTSSPFKNNTQLKYNGASAGYLFSGKITDISTTTHTTQTIQLMPTSTASPKQVDTVNNLWLVISNADFAKYFY